MCDLAGVAGFEPTNDGIKNRCLTTWRHPKRFLHSSKLLKKLQALLFKFIISWKTNGRDTPHSGPFSQP